MSAIRFTCSCPFCERLLDLGVEWIGRTAHCHHCGESFRAVLPTRYSDEDREMDAKIDRLLDAAERHVSRFATSLARPSPEDVDW